MANFEPVKKSLVIFLTWLFGYAWLAVACEDAELDTENIDPFMRVVFINDDSLQVLNLLVADIDTTVADITGVLDSLDTVNVDNQFDSLISALDSTRRILNRDRNGFATTISDIQSGSVMISSITSPDGVTPLIPPVDSAEVFVFPLNAGADFSNFVVSLDGRFYTLETTYERSTLMEQRTVIVEASNLIVTSDDFDSLTQQCLDTATTTCISNETVVTLYF